MSNNLSTTNDKRIASAIEENFDAFGIKCTVTGVTENLHESVYELTFPQGIAVAHFQRYANDIAFWLGIPQKELEIEIPIPGKPRLAGVHVLDKWERDIIDYLDERDERLKEIEEAKILKRDYGEIGRFLSIISVPCFVIGGVLIRLGHIVFNFGVKILDTFLDTEEK